MRKFISILLVMVFIFSFLTGCQSKKPEGVNQEFYDDMIECLKKLEKAKGDKDNNGSDVVKKYIDDKVWLNTKEVEIVEAVDELYFWVWMYYNGTSKNRMLVINEIGKVSELMNLDININKIIPKE